MLIIIIIIIRASTSTLKSFLATALPPYDLHDLLNLSYYSRVNIGFKVLRTVATLISIFQITLTAIMALLRDLFNLLYYQRVSGDFKKPAILYI